MTREDFINWVKENPDEIYKFLIPNCPDDMMGVKCKCENHRNGKGMCAECWFETINEFNEVYNLKK